ncbi:MAG TPA: thermosome subunit beta [Candidatus Acidoferrales bacterium]|nr:thermosome subunit beta [Candidatus Acidoferrales bacterium]
MAQRSTRMGGGTTGQLINAGGQPILILKEGTTRTRGEEAQSMNIEAARAVANAVRTTLGPKGMDKMLVDSIGDVVITNDGATILKEMDIEHPAAKMVVEVAKTQDDEVGDGTTTAVVLVGELLKEAEELLEEDIHPTVISAGFNLAAKKSIDTLSEMATEGDDKVLKNIAMTAITGKGAEMMLSNISDIVVDAVKTVAEDVDGKKTVDFDNISVIKRYGASVGDSKLVHGIIIDKEKVHPLMPTKVKHAKIALLNVGLEIEKTEIDAKIEINDPSQMQSFWDQEEKRLEEIANKVIATGATVVFCQKGIDDLVQHYLAKANILAGRRIKKSDMKRLERATGAKITDTIEDITQLGSAGLVIERKVGDNEMIFVEECQNPKACSILLRGSIEHVVDELDRAVHDALKVVSLTLEDNKVLPGGGAPEIELSMKLRDYATTVGGREQLSIRAFANAIEVIPKTLVENAGQDPLDKLVEAKSAHEAGNSDAGITMNGEVKNMIDLNIIDPLKVKINAIESATEAAIMIIRIDDVIAAGAMGGKGGLPEMD